MNITSIDIGKFYTFVYWLNSIAFSNIYFSFAYFIITIFVFIYINFLIMEKNGFNKENTLDTTFLALTVFFPSLYLFYLLTGSTILVLYNGGTLFLVFSLFFFLYIKSKISNWSFYKLIDIFAISLSLVFSLIYLYLSFYLLNYIYIAVSLAYFMLYKKFLKNIFGKSIWLLFFVKLKKDETLSFIGGIGLVFILYTLLIQLSLYVYNFNTVNIVLILLIGLFIYLIIKRSRKNKVLWQFHMNLFPLKKLSLRRKKQSLN